MTSLHTKGGITEWFARFYIRAPDLVGKSSEEQERNWWIETEEWT